jgi:hypothetical protein
MKTNGLGDGFGPALISKLARRFIPGFNVAREGVINGKSSGVSEPTIFRSTIRSSNETQNSNSNLASLQKLWQGGIPVFECVYSALENFLKL